MPLNPRPLTRHLRLLSLVLVGAGAFYLLRRYDVLRLPPERCSPLLRFSAGDRLLLDRRPVGFHLGDAVLFVGPEGSLYLAAVEQVRPARAAPGAVEALWLATTDPDCRGEDSSELGWIPVADVRARVLLVWPW